MGKLLVSAQGNPPHSKLLAPLPTRGFERSRRPRGWAHPPELRLPGGPRSAEKVAATSGLREAEKANAGGMTGEEGGRRRGRRGGQLGGRCGRDHRRTEPHARHPMAPLTPGSAELLLRKARDPRRSRIAPSLREARGKGRRESFCGLAGLAGSAGATAGGAQPRGLDAARAGPSEPAAAAGARWSGRDARLGPGAALGGAGMRGRQGPPPESPGPRPPPPPRPAPTDPAAAPAPGEARGPWLPLRPPPRARVRARAIVSAVGAPCSLPWTGRVGSTASDPPNSSPAEVWPMGLGGGAETLSSCFAVC